MPLLPFYIHNLICSLEIVRTSLKKKKADEGSLLVLPTTTDEWEDKMHTTKRERRIWLCTLVPELRVLSFHCTELAVSESISLTGKNEPYPISKTALAVGHFSVVLCKQFLSFLWLKSTSRGRGGAQWFSSEPIGARFFLQKMRILSFEDPLHNRMSPRLYFESPTTF